jgi:hypothetical protein
MCQTPTTTSLRSSIPRHTQDAHPEGPDPQDLAPDGRCWSWSRAISRARSTPIARPRMIEPILKRPGTGDTSCTTSLGEVDADQVADSRGHVYHEVVACLARRQSAGCPRSIEYHGEWNTGGLPQQPHVNLEHGRYGGHCWKP